MLRSPLKSRTGIDGKGKEMKGTELRGAKEALKREWTRLHPELAASLEGKDYKSLFEMKRA